MLCFIMPQIIYFVYKFICIQTKAACPLDKTHQSTKKALRADPDGHQAILFRFTHNLAGAAGHASLVRSAHIIPAVRARRLVH